MSRRTDVVGAQEAAQILDVEVPRISRWRDGGKMPPTVALLASGPLWRVVDVRKLAQDGKWKGRKPQPLDVLGLSEVAALLEVDKSVVGRWRREGKFPEPYLDKRQPGTPWTPGAGLAATPLWERGPVAVFKADRDERREAA